MDFDTFSFVDDYVAGDLTGPDLAAFRRMLVKDEVLRQAVAKEQKFRDVFGGYDPELMDSIDRIVDETGASKGSSLKPWILGLLLVIGIGVGLYWVLHYIPTTDNPPADLPSPTYASDSLLPDTTTILEEDTIFPLSTPSPLQRPSQSSEKPILPAPSSPANSEKVRQQIFAALVEEIRPIGDAYLEELRPVIRGKTRLGTDLDSLVKSGDNTALLMFLDEKVDDGIERMSRGILRLRNGRLKDAAKDFTYVSRKFELYRADADLFYLAALGSQLPADSAEYQTVLRRAQLLGGPYTESALRIDSLVSKLW